MFLASIVAVDGSIGLGMFQVGAVGGLFELYELDVELFLQQFLQFGGF